MITDAMIDWSFSELFSSFVSMKNSNKFEIQKPHLAHTKYDTRSDLIKLTFTALH